MEIKGTPAELSQYLAGIPRTVIITGDGEIKKAADRAVITLKVSTENKSLQEAMRLNQDVRGKVQELLKGQGIQADRIQAAKFSSTPRFGWFSDKAKSYKIENSVKVTVQDEKEFQAVSGAVDKWPEVQFLNLEFEHANKDDMKKQAVTKACDNASERQKLYEAKLGVKLVPKGFTEEYVAPATRKPAYVTGTYYGSVNGTPSTVYQAPAKTSGEPDGDLAEAVSPFGEVTYSATVRVEYTVEPN